VQAHNLIRVALLLPGSKAPGGDTLQLDRRTAPEPAAGSGMLKWAIALFVLLASGAGFLAWTMLRRRVPRHPAAPAGLPEDPPLAEAAGLAPLPEPEPVSGLENHPRKPEDWGPILDALRQMETKVTAAAETKLAEMLGTFVSAEEARQTATFELTQRVQKLEERLRSEADDEGERLRRLIAELTEEAVEGGSAPGASPEERTLIAKGIGDAVSRYCQNGVPDARLNELAGEIKRVLKAIDAVAAYRELPEPAASRLSVARRGLTEMLDELGAFSADRQARRAHLRFSVDYSLLAASNQTLAGALAEALKREIVKWERPAQYFERQLNWLSVSAVTTLSDAADAYWDSDRRDPELQSLLANLFQAADLEQICPARNAPWVSVEQDATNTAPRTAPDERPEAVARVNLRGLKRRQQVVRKAQVTLFG
jgi:hypothetical protein